MTKAAATPDADMALRGGLDRVESDGTLRGWCWWPAHPREQRLVEVLVDGEVMAEAICDQSRPDLVLANVGDGSHGFVVQLPQAAMASGVTVRIGLRDLETQQAVGSDCLVTWDDVVEAHPASPPTLPPALPPVVPSPLAALPFEPPHVAGNVDRVTRDGWVSGWCWSPSEPGRRVALAIWVDDEIVGGTVASMFRADLQDAGIGDGGHGFSYALPYEVLAERGRMRVSVRDAGTGELLSEPVDLRLGRMAQTEQRVVALERQVRLLRGQIEELARRDQGSPQADQRAATALFGTVAGFFRALADGGVEGEGVGLGGGLRGARDDLVARLPALTLRVAVTPRATLCILADSAAEAVHRCLLALHEAGTDAIADIVLLDDGRTDPRVALLPSLVRNLRYQRAPATLAAAAGAAWRDGRAALGALCSPRLQPTPDWLATLADTLEQPPKAALATAIVVRPDGVVQHAGLLLRAGGMAREAGDFAAADQPEARFMRRADAVTASAFVVDRTAFVTAGGFSASYESLDHATIELCLRLRAAGRAVLVQPAAAALCGPEWPDPVPDLSAPTEDARALRVAVLQALAVDGAGRPGAAFAGHALVVDDDAPRPDRDAGSVSAFEHMRVLVGLGWRVTFMAANGGIAAEGDRRRLEAAGIEVVQPPHFASLTHYLEDHGAGLDLAQVYRYRNAAMLEPRLRELAPQAKVVFMPADLHFLRAEREAAVTGRELETSRDAELACIAAADATLLFSDYERDLVAPGVDPAKLHLLRWIVRPRAGTPGFAGRAGLLFVGSYQHAPNVDAVEWMAAAVMPLLRAMRPGLVLHVVGANPPASLRAVAGPDIVLHGWVPDLAALWDSVRLSVAPLRFGAGFKGKVATSLANGVPVVATAMALEGTGLASGDGVAQADEPEAIARAIVRLHDDAEVWASLSRAGLDRVAALYSPAAARTVYRAMLAGLGLGAEGL